MDGASLTKADEEEATSLRCYRQLRERGNRQELIASWLLAWMLCSLQVAILLLSNGWAQPVLAGATLVFCFGVSLRLVLPLPARTSPWRRRQPGRPT
jgi:hypothetical protein